MMYAVTYGPEWEDIAYYSDVTKAKTKLLVQTLGGAENRFFPIMYEYCDDGGVYRRSKNAWCVDIIELKRLTNVSTFDDYNALDDRNIAISAVKEMSS